jgi:hypothetical protein
VRVVGDGGGSLSGLRIQVFIAALGCACDYEFLPPTLFARIVQRVLGLRRSGTAVSTSREAGRRVDSLRRALTGTTEC